MPKMLRTHGPTDALTQQCYLDHAGIKYRPDSQRKLCVCIIGYE